MDRRRAPRRRRFPGARITFSGRSSTMDRVVRNITDASAKLGVAGRTSLPRVFGLTIAHRGLEARSRIVRRRGTEVGGALLALADGRARSEIVPLSDARRLGECEREKAALRQRMEQLTSG